MRVLEPMLQNDDDWILVGSSFGGLMAAAWTCRHPDRVVQLILLAPALHHPQFAQAGFAPIDVPTLHVHGTKDTVVPLDAVRPIAKQVFRDWTLRDVDDDHQLHRTVRQMDWPMLLRRV